MAHNFIRGFQCRIACAWQPDIFHCSSLTVAAVSWACRLPQWNRLHWNPDCHWLLKLDWCLFYRWGARWCVNRDLLDSLDTLFRWVPAKAAFLVMIKTLIRHKSAVYMCSTWCIIYSYWTRNSSNIVHKMAIGKARLWTLPMLSTYYRSFCTIMTALYCAREQHKTHRLSTVCVVRYAICLQVGQAINVGLTRVACESLLPTLELEHFLATTDGQLLSLVSLPKHWNTWLKKSIALALEVKLLAFTTACNIRARSCVTWSSANTCQTCCCNLPGRPWTPIVGKQPEQWHWLSMLCVYCRHPSTSHRSIPSQQNCNMCLIGRPSAPFQILNKSKLLFTVYQTCDTI